jgi:hypothetical protein
MSFRLCVLVLVSSIGLTVACERVSSPSVAPSDSANIAPMPSTAGGASLSAVKGALERLINIEDACDPETFNAAIGPGTCVRSGGVQFDNFLSLLRRNKSIGGWHFGPPNLTMQAGEKFVAINRGGEVHTFTEVDEFGGGIVPLLNDAVGLTTVAPECLALDPEDFIAPGSTFREANEEEGEKPGNVRYQCCIHPWMRLEARVLDK